MPHVIVLGSTNTDLVIRGPRLPLPGETVLGGEFYRAHGGKGANQAVAAARVSKTPVTFLGAVGDDSFGREALEHFENENLDTRFLKVISETASGVALILVDQHGENSISVASGANMALDPSAVDALPDEVFNRADVFLACLESPLNTVTQGLARAKAAGLTTILNPAPADLTICSREFLSLVDLITPNEGEAAMLAGKSLAVDSMDEEMRVANAVEAARHLQSLGCGGCIVTRGNKGCLVVEHEVTQLPAYRVDPVDATGAGDAFNGTLAVALAEGHPLVDAARWASRAAAIAVTRAGAQPSLPARDEIDTFSTQQY